MIRLTTDLCMASAEWYAYYSSNLNEYAEYCDKLHKWIISSFFGNLLQL